MKFTEQIPARIIRTGRGAPIEIRDCGRVALDADEQLTFVTERGGEYDVTRKAWGFYATPSLNGRLAQFGLRAALVRNVVGKYYVFLIETGQEERCREYLRAEQNVLVRWLDNESDLGAIVAKQESASLDAAAVRCICGLNRLATVHMYFARPAGEVDLGIASNAYRRELLQCGVCGHFLSVHQMDVRRLYDGDYVDKTYGGLEGMRRQFERIQALPPERSDNAGRVARLIAFAAQHFADRSAKSVLDVGSGLGVFPDRMRQAGWAVTALDPDRRAVEHVAAAGVRAVHGDFLDVDSLERYDLITFNKVLEHVADPVAMLARAAAFLKPGGLVYVELPDGELAVRDPDQFGREEFFIEHLHVFSAASASLLAMRAGFDAAAVERLREPSGKYTLRVFATRRHA